MAHLIFNSAYDFYKLEETERIALIGRTIKERMWRLKHGKVVYTDAIRPGLYFPIGLHPSEFNYGIQQGLLYVTDVLKMPAVQGDTQRKKWFRVAAFSPDDLDIDLDFDDTETHLRQEIIQFIRGPMHKRNRRYREIMEQIKKHFSAGTITS